MAYPDSLQRSSLVRMRVDESQRDNIEFSGILFKKK